MLILDDICPLAATFFTVFIVGRLTTILFTACIGLMVYCMSCVVAYCTLNLKNVYFFYHLFETNFLASMCQKSFICDVTCFCPLSFEKNDA